MLDGDRVELRNIKRELESLRHTSNLQSLNAAAKGESAPGCVCMCMCVCVCVSGHFPLLRIHLHESLVPYHPQATPSLPHSFTPPQTQRPPPTTSSHRSTPPHHLSHGHGASPVDRPSSSSSPLLPSPLSSLPAAPSPGRPTGPQSYPSPTPQPKAPPDDLARLEQTRAELLASGQYSPNDPVIAQLDASVRIAEEKKFGT